MAVIGLIRIESAGQVDHDRLQELVEQRIAAAGGPPDGLMAHVAHPDGDGFVIVEAWRTEELFRASFDTIVLPSIRDAGLSHVGPEIRDAWSIARP